VRAGAFVYGEVMMDESGKEEERVYFRGLLAREKWEKEKKKKKGKKKTFSLPAWHHSRAGEKGQGKEGERKRGGKNRAPGES